MLNINHSFWILDEVSFGVGLMFAAPITQAYIFECYDIKEISGMIFVKFFIEDEFLEENLREVFGSFVG